MTKFMDTIKMAKAALNLSRDIFSSLQKTGGCEYYHEDTVGSRKCKHSKNKKAMPSDQTRIIYLSCSVTNCPFITNK